MFSGVQQLHTFAKTIMVRIEVAEELCKYSPCTSKVTIDFQKGKGEAKISRTISQTKQKSKSHIFSDYVSPVSVLF